MMLSFCIFYITVERRRQAALAMSARPTTETNGDVFYCLRISGERAWEVSSLLKSAGVRAGNAPDSLFETMFVAREAWDIFWADFMALHGIKYLITNNVFSVITSFEPMTFAQLCIVFLSL